GFAQYLVLAQALARKDEPDCRIPVAAFEQRVVDDVERVVVRLRTHGASRRKFRVVVPDCRHAAPSREIIVTCDPTWYTAARGATSIPVNLRIRVPLRW